MNTLEAPLGPPVRRIEKVAPVSVHKSPSGKTIVDFGQNLVGRLSIKVKGTAGHTVTPRHAEVLENGELGTRPLRFAEATDRYTLKGGIVCAGGTSWCSMRHCITSSIFKANLCTCCACPSTVTTNTGNCYGTIRHKYFKVIIRCCKIFNYRTFRNILRFLPHFIPVCS